MEQDREINPRLESWRLADSGTTVDANEFVARCGSGIASRGMRQVVPQDQNSGQFRKIEEIHRGWTELPI